MIVLPQLQQLLSSSRKYVYPYHYRGREMARRTRRVLPHLVGEAPDVKMGGFGTADIDSKTKENG